MRQKESGDEVSRDDFQELAGCMKYENDLLWVVSPSPPAAVPGQGGRRFVWAINTAAGYASGRDSLKTKIPFTPELAHGGETPELPAPVTIDGEMYEKAEKMLTLIRLNLSYDKSLMLNIIFEVITARRWSAPSLLTGLNVSPEARGGPEALKNESLSTGIGASAKEDPAALFPAIGYVLLSRGWVRAVAVDRDKHTRMLHVVTLEPHQLDSNLGGAFVPRSTCHVDENSHLLAPQQLFNTPMVGLTVEEAATTGYEGLNGQPALWPGTDDIRYEEFLPNDEDLCWIVEIYSSCTMIGKRLSGAIAVTSRERHKTGEPSIVTASSTLGYINEQLYKTHGKECQDLEEKLYVAVLRRLQVTLHKDPLTLNKEEKQQLRQLRQLLDQYRSDGYQKSLEIVTALHWDIPFVMNGADGVFPLTADDVDPEVDVSPPTPVDHRQHFPNFPFLGLTQLWGGEAFSVAVDRDPGTNMLRVVTLADYEFAGCHEMYYFYPISLLHVPDRFFKVLTETEIRSREEKKNSRVYERV